MVPKTPSRDRIHGTHKGSADADKIPAKPMIPMSRHTCSRSDEYQHHRCYSERTSRCVAAGRGRPFGAHFLDTIFSSSQSHCASGHVRYRLLSFLQGHCASEHVRYRLLSFLQGHCASEHVRYRLLSFLQGHCASGHVLYRLLSSLQGHCASGHGHYDNIMDYL
ncbi:hypothetical protein EV363DRAFT_467198 [Boletus edulis]|nr:hypothetical protein EV363DRAFT_467198 [Boletus edulis]